MHKLLLLSAAGAAGTLSRYWLSGVMNSIMGKTFPWGTSAVNVLGCFLFGLVAVLADERMILRPETRIIILVGFMGAFTTFSSLIFETSELMRGAQWLYASLNLFGETLLGFLALFLGAALGRLL